METFIMCPAHLHRTSRMNDLPYIENGRGVLAE